MTAGHGDTGTDASTPHGDGRRTGRRAFITAVGAAVATATLATDESVAAQYDTVVDVTEAGADDTGGESITPVLEDIRDRYGGSTLYRFPPGRYYMSEQFRFTGFSNVGFVGDDATLVPADYHTFDGPQYRLFRLGKWDRPARNLRFEGFTVDQTAADTGIRVVEAQVKTGLEVRDVTVNGVHDSGTWGPALFDVVEPGGWGVVERFEAPDGAVHSRNAPGDLWHGPTGILVSRYHEGDLRLDDCVLGGFPDNGLYAVTNGSVEVVGGEYANSNAASIRLAGHDCTVRGATVRVDRNPDGFTNQRGIRLDGGTDFRVEDTTIDLSAPNGHGITVYDGVDSARIEDSKVTVGERVFNGIVISDGTGPIDIVNTNVEIHESGNAIQINGADAGTVVCERVQIWGTAPGSTMRHAIRCERNGCEFRKVKVWQPGPDMRRAIVLNGDDCLVYDGVYKARHHPVLVNGARAWIEDAHLESYDEHESIRLNEGADDATIKGNALVDGLFNDGADSLSIYGNSW